MIEVIVVVALIAAVLIVAVPKVKQLMRPVVGRETGWVDAVDVSVTPRKELERGQWPLAVRTVLRGVEQPSPWTEPFKLPKAARRQVFYPHWIISANRPNLALTDRRERKAALKASRASESFYRMELPVPVAVEVCHFRDGSVEVRGRK